MLRKQRTPILAAAAAVIALGVATPPAHADGKPVRVGVLTDMSGNYADPAGKGAVIAAQMAIDELGGKVLGRPVELLQADHQNKADVGSVVARKWFDVDGVDAVFEMVSSAVALAVQDIAREKKKVTVATGAATSALTGAACSPTGIHWVYDTYSQANSTARELVRQGGDSWYFITADYAFGHALQADATAIIEANGGKVLGAVRHPLGTVDFASYLLQAQASGAKIIAFANAGKDFSTAITQATEFGLGSDGKQKLAALLVTLSEAHALGTKGAQGLYLTEGFYWGLNDETRAWSQKFYERHKAMPTSFQAGTYSAVRHYLRAVEAAGTDDADAVVAKMREMPVDDMFARGGKVRPDGRMVHDMVFAQVKSPSESKGEWDLYKIVQTVPGDAAFRPLDKGGCKLAAR
ncbi:ABC transporter substrate-binding protein [Azospirillum canadense]|uniref:ABC transporter substrate-binding protein n=1 Tax=Azospirillum canadense TaxID=403962 RepID=UPI0022266C31|nr:ABC transporter substrate-binding protein [Azospirillum canadense]MCW2239734.1 branched-chain amino acid transport system substrate-binding protein [Azospirillum canadense]